ncbi:MAG: hypothetical protein GY833_07310 [Aestuariibacter sp.]|nr:hypothetical protein [Aestuariibacter sp.]
MYKTASQIGDIVLDKLSIDRATLMTGIGVGGMLAGTGYAGYKGIKAINDDANELKRHRAQAAQAQQQPQPQPQPQPGMVR